ncbi:MAG: site-specific integrase [Clostridiales bacterium]|nr:site-specific integrase [Clostridiales bacterium]
MKKKRINGEGNIRKRSEHSWEASLRTEDGERLYVYGGSQKEVKEKLQGIKAEIANGTYVPETEMTVGEWMDEWYECFTTGLKASSRARYEQDIRNHIKPGIGHIMLQELKLLHVQRFLNQCKDKKGLSLKTVKNIYLILSKAMSKAQTQGLIRNNPCAEVEIPSYDEPQKEMRPLKDGEVSEFLARIKGNPFENLYYMALFTGMRESELIGLTWDCINFDTGNIHLYRQFKAIRGKSRTWTFTTLKNKQTRDFIVPPSVIRVLKKQKTQQAEWKLLYGSLYRNDNNLVFTNEYGSHLATRTVYKRFKAIVTSMGLPDVRFHDLRHTYATLALQNGVDVKTVSHNLGHATVAFTMDKYTHMSMTMQKDSVSKMESFIASL